eukprot:547390-Pleurochrysis_carterae.AAC.3
MRLDCVSERHLYCCVGMPASSSSRPATWPCAWTTSRIAATASGGGGRGPSRLWRSAHEYSRYDSRSSVSVLLVSACTNCTVSTIDERTEKGKREANCSHPRSGAGTAPARSVSQWIK